MTVKVTIPEDSRQRLENVLRDTLLFRGGDPVRLVHKAMAYIASFAIASGSNAKIPIADKEKIRAALKTIVTNSSRRFRKSKTGRRVKVKRSKVVSEWTGTLAAVLVSTIHSWGTRTRSSRRQTKVILRLIGGAANRRAVTPSVFYRAVAGFAGSRAGSAGYLRSGLIPALKLFQAKARAPLGFKHPPGTATAARHAPLIRASLEDYALGIDKVAPRALRTAEREVAVQFDKWLKQAHEEAAQKTGQLTRA